MTEPDSLATKQVIVIRRDLKSRRGKEIAQGSHAAMAWLRDRIISEGKNSADGYGTDWHVESLIELSQAEYDWLSDGCTKIVCQVPDEEALLAARDAAWLRGVTAHLITDAGYTEFYGEPTNTAVAIGPDRADIIDAVTGDLALY